MTIEAAGNGVTGPTHPDAAHSGDPEPGANGHTARAATVLGATSRGWRAMLCDDLEKVFPRRDPRPFDDSIPLTGFVGERISLQVAVHVRLEPWFPAQDELSVQVTCPGADVQLSRVGLVPVVLPAFPGHDEHYLDDQPGLYPDLLVPVGQGAQELGQLGWNAFWIDLVLGPDAGPVHVVVTHRDAGSPPERDASVLLDATVPVEVTPEPAPPTPIRHLAWLHADGIATWYGVDTWSEDHWTAIEHHVASAVEMGVTAILTPVWTPPLDTRVGSIRRTTQLLAIRDDGPDGEPRYSFDTTLLDRWLDVLRRRGVHSVEVPHLFTQWGARATPQVWVDAPAGPEQRFGWHVAATDASYRRFLEAMVPFLRAHLRRAGFDDAHQVWHLSDEPDESQVDDYRAARGVVADLLAGATVVDALSSPDFVELVDEPIVATDHVHSFLERGLPVRSVYYCVAQHQGVANRFIAQDGVGCRVLGTQMFVQGADTFLHWGYDFYLTQESVRPVDPFADTCAGGRFLGGDSFVVYPGPDGTVLHSQRHRLLASMTADQRVMAWASHLLGRDAVVALVDPDGLSAGVRGYESAWPTATQVRERRLALDRAVRQALRHRA